MGGNLLSTGGIPTGLGTDPMAWAPAILRPRQKAKGKRYKRGQAPHLPSFFYLLPLGAPRFISAGLPHGIAGQDALDLLRKAACADRLADKAIEAGPARPVHILRHDIGGHRYDNGVMQPRMPPNLLQHGVAILVWDLDVQQDQIQL